MGPVRSLVVLASCVQRSIECIAVVAVVLDSAANGVLAAAIGTIASIVGAAWWITRWVVVCGKGYLQGSNCNQENACKT